MRTTLTGIFALAAKLVLALPGFGPTVGDITGLNQLYQWGNVRRNVITGPGISTWDFSTLKDFPFAERRFVECRVEAFNFANHANFGDPNASLTSNAVNSATGVAIPGTISSLQSGIDMRELQFSLKVVS